ncbi:MAG: hypothetical protein VYA55_13100 [Pseudomonadota bacterium]|nr:hypothetical protein [Pseudomonadota bacterium]
MGRFAAIMPLKLQEEVAVDEPGLPETLEAKPQFVVSKAKLFSLIRSGWRNLPPNQWIALFLVFLDSGFSRRLHPWIDRR